MFVEVLWRGVFRMVEMEKRTAIRIQLIRVVYFRYIYRFQCIQ